MRDNEERAKQIISNCYRCHLEEIDTETHKGLHDYEIVLPGQREAVEVTTATNEAVRGLVAAIERDSNRIGPLDGTRGWQVTISHPRHLGVLSRKLEMVQKLLLNLDSAGVHGFLVRRDRYRFPEVRALAEAFPEIQDGSSWEESPASLWVVRERLRGGVNTDVLDGFLTNLLWSDDFADNRKKLDASGTPRRHLFLWVERPEFTPWLTLCESRPPLTHPELPPEITDLWIAADCRDGLRVWWTNPPSAWLDVTADANADH